MSDTDTDERRSGESRNQGAERKTFREGTFIFREGEPGDMAFIVMNGKVQILKDYENNPTVLSMLQKGGMFGEMALIDDQPRMASARAVDGPVEALVVTRPMFEQKLGRLDPFTRGLIKILSGNARAAADT